MSRRLSLTTLAAAAVALTAAGSLTACGPTGHPGSQNAASASPTGSPTQAGSPPPSPAPVASEPSAGTSASVTGSGASTHRTAGLPASAWMAPSAIPLDTTYRWADPAGTARAVNNPSFAFERFCHSTRDPSNDLSDWHGPAAQAQLGTGTRADWQGQQTIIEFPGSSNDAMQLSWSLYQGLLQELGTCADSASGAKVTKTSNGQQSLAAVITIPQPGGGTVTVHQYLVLTGTTVAELALWSNRPSPAWSASPDATVLRSLTSRTCAAFRSC